MSASTGAFYSDYSQLKQRRKENHIEEDELKVVQKEETRTKKSLGGSAQKRVDWFISTVLTMWAGYIRLWKISQPTSVVFDEVHFGGFASKYITKKFFMDVHPPLAKMMITWAAQLAGFNGSFDFKEIGMDYLEANVPYVFIRSFCAVNGIMLVPFAYFTMRGCKFSVATSILTALMVCYENGFITNNRLILLDSILIFFTSFTFLMYINFQNQFKNSFKTWWWTWLILTGAGLGFTVSSKWVGLFTIASIGAGVLKELWDLWGNQKIKMHTFVKHFIARAMCLILLPCILYMFFFAVHFSMLTETGGGTTFMSPEFQTSLEGINFPEKTPADIVYGAKIDIRHMGTRGGYLHSHSHTYPGGSQQQQITLYSHVDDNNWWVINKAETDNVTELEYVKHGDIVRLNHYTTKRRLHTHDVRPTTSSKKYHYEVTAYGFEGFSGDTNDNWRVEVIGHIANGTVEENRLIARRSEFRLISQSQGCALFSRQEKLPSWGFKQQEVLCMKDAKKAKTIWRIESTESELLPEESKQVGYLSKGFFDRFLELNKVMWHVNQGLSSSHSYGSRPQDWPTLRRGISFWTSDNLKIYLLGNPLVFWASSAAIIAYATLKATFMILNQRQTCTNLFGNEWSKYDAAGGFFFVSWALHYLPFGLMGRQLFLHHYMPSLYMAILVTGASFELVTSHIYRHVRWSLAIISTLAVIYVYRIFIPITYAEPWTQSECLSATWKPSWDFNCKMFDKKLENIPIIQNTTDIENNVNNYVVDKFVDVVDDLNDQEEVRSG